MHLHDALTLDAPRRTRDGFLAVRAKSARTGVYQYSGYDVDPTNAHGLRDAPIVNVLRDAATVFDHKAAHSFIGKPITDDHPAVPVTKDNWRDHARGTVMGAKWEEGGYLAFDLLLTDGEAIAKVDAGKRELSNGYDATLEYGDFTAADGTKCQARQTNIRGNHIALVDRGRAGPECRIADERAFATCDANPEAVARLSTENAPMKIRIGDAEVDATNGEAVRVANDARETAFKALSDRATTAETQVATLTTDKATLDAKVITLETQLADAKLTPQALRDAAKAYQTTVDKAKVMGVIVTDAMDEPAIHKAVVLAKVGDAAKDWNDAQIVASFATLTKDAKIHDATVHSIGAPVVMGDAASLRDKARLDYINGLNGQKKDAA